MPSPKITSLTPIVLADKRRVMLELTVENLPSLFSNVTLTMPDIASGAATPPAKPDPNAPSPYPNVELLILNGQRQEIASIYIVEHREASMTLTLHLRRPNVNENYIARAEMSYQHETIDVKEVPFTLS